MGKAVDDDHIEEVLTRDGRQRLVPRIDDVARVVDQQIERLIADSR